MEADLKASLHELYGDEPTAIMQKHLDFALSTRKRGAKFIDRVVAETGLDLRGKRVLDVGSAYAGFVIEAAARGAEAWGVEISAKLHRLGRLNASGEPGDIQLVEGDFLSRRTLRELPRDFDLVVVNDVFEHVYDTAALLKQLHTLLRAGRMFAFSIPNGDAVSAVEREGHYGTPGITQLPPNLWHRIVPHFTAYYHPWSYYSAMFRGFGFGQVDAWGARRKSLGTIRDEIAEGLQRGAAAVERLEVDTTMRRVVGKAFEEYRARVEEDLATGDAAMLQWRYLATFWKGLAYKVGSVSADVDERPPRTLRLLSPRRLARRVRQELQVLFPPAGKPSADPRAMVRVDLTAVSEPLASRWSRNGQMEITRVDGAIRCEVTANDGAESQTFAGIRVPVDPPATIRLDLELLGAEEIEGFYIDGENSRRRRCLRWSMLGLEHADTRRWVVDLDAGVDRGRFRAVDPSTPDEVRELQIFAKVRPGARAGFVVHGLEIRPRAR